MDLMKKYLSRIKVDDSKSEGHVVRAQNAYRIYSKILEDYLWLVATDKEMRGLVEEGIEDAIYTHDDIRKLDGMSKDGLRKINIIKRALPGSKVEEIG